MFDEPWFHPFISALKIHGGVIAPAARAISINPARVYHLMKTDGDFKAAVEDAQEETYDDMERELARRALEGVEEPVIYQGQMAFRMEVALDGEGKEVWRKKLDEHGQPIPLTVNKKSDALLMFALKGYRKKRFADRTELTGADGEGVKLIDETSRAARLSQLLEVARRRASTDNQPEADPDIGEYA